MSRKNMEFTEPVIVKLHPDMVEHLDRAAERDYCTRAEYLRRLILKDMRDE